MLGIEYISFNRLFYTKQTLPNVLRSTSEPAEIVIVDNGSVDGAADFIKGFAVGECKHEIKKILNKQNIGLQKALNQGVVELERMDKSRGMLNIIVFTANDIMLPDGWDVVVKRVFKGNESIGIVGFNGTDHILKNNREIVIDGVKVVVNAGTGGPLCVRRDVLRKIGGWGGTKYKYGGVDGSTRSRVIHHGFKICFIKDLYYIHLEHNDRERYSHYVAKKYRIHSSFRNSPTLLKKAAELDKVKPQEKCDWSIE